jgi:transposase-like protein
MTQEPKTLADAIVYFQSPDNCIDYLALRRWPKGVACPTCGRKDVAFVPSRRLWQCKTRHPKAQFSIKTGTVLEDSPLGLEKWLPVMWMVANCKNGVSSWEIHRSLGVSQKAAWFMLHRIRLGMQDKTDGGKLGGGPDSEVEIDETYIGGKARNMHREKRERLSADRGMQGGHGKTVVMGILERDGKVKASVLGHRREKKQMHALISEHVAPGTWIHTDEFSNYDGLPDHYTHFVVNHLERYVEGNVHTNGIENFWSLLKRGLGGTYVAVEPFHLFRYVDEQAFRFNNRATKNNPMNDSDRFSLLCEQIVGKRLTYAQLTAKEDKKPEVPF